MRRKYIAVAPLLLFSAASLAQDQQPDYSIKRASRATIAAQAAAAEQLPLEDGFDEAFASRGFLGTRSDPLIRNADGRVVTDLDAYAWVTGNAPPTVNPSLWRHMKILARHGLYEVGDGIWQVRGFDISNMTVIEGDSGWIVVDPLLTAEVARAALDLVNQTLGPRPVRALIYTHGHVDHFGGAGGVVDPADAAAGKVAVMAPEGFLTDATEENVLSGPATSRRGSYQVNMAIEPGVQGLMGGGVGPIVSRGRVTLVPPNDSVSKTGETRTIDGVELQFQMVSGSEAPSEFNILIPAKNTLLIGEIASCSLHNIATPRGALVRDALKWSDFLTEAVESYAPLSDTLVTSHCWPRFGRQNILDHLTLQRDSYRYIHDQTVRLFNQGLTADEIAETFADLPEALTDEWSTRGYYGTYKFNARAVYQRYLGAYDGVPAHLDPLPPEERARRYVAAMGGADAVLAHGRQAMEGGEYRWASDLLNQLVFAEPGNIMARALLADTYEQLGYQQELAVWRSIYLSGAHELRGGEQASAFAIDEQGFAAVPTRLALNVLASRVDPKVLAGRRVTVNFTFEDTGEQASLSFSNGVLLPRLGSLSDDPDIALVGPKQMLGALFLAKRPLKELVRDGIEWTGDASAMALLQSAISIPPTAFDIAEP